MNWKGKIKADFVHRWHDSMHENPNKYTKKKKILEVINKLARSQDIRQVYKYQLNFYVLKKWKAMWKC